MNLNAIVVTLFSLCVLTVYSETPRSEYEKPDALVEIVPGSDDRVYGKLALYKENHGVYIEGLIHNLTPGLHGFHVHDKGLLGNKCKDAAGHFNPVKKTHGGPTDIHRHAGDLGNIYADYQGLAKISVFDGHISLDPMSKIFIGKRSFVVHEHADDLGRGGNDESLKTGNAGSRVGCGIIIVLGHSLKHPPPVYQPGSGSQRQTSAITESKIHGSFNDGLIYNDDDIYSNIVLSTGDPQLFRDQVLNSANLHGLGGGDDIFSSRYNSHNMHSLGSNENTHHLNLHSPSHENSQLFNLDTHQNAHFLNSPTLQSSQLLNLPSHQNPHLLNSHSHQSSQLLNLPSHQNPHLLNSPSHQSSQLMNFPHQNPHLLNSHSHQSSQLLNFPHQNPHSLNSHSHQSSQLLNFPQQNPHLLNSHSHQNAHLFNLPSQKSSTFLNSHSQQNNYHSPLHNNGQFNLNPGPLGGYYGSNQFGLNHRKKMNPQQNIFGSHSSPSSMHFKIPANRAANRARKHRAKINKKNTGSSSRQKGQKKRKQHKASARFHNVGSNHNIYQYPAPGVSSTHSEYHYPKGHKLGDYGSYNHHQSGAYQFPVPSIHNSGHGGYDSHHGGYDSHHNSYSHPVSYW